MSRFYIGQPVRVNCPESINHGAETFVRATNVQPSYMGISARFIGTEVAIPLTSPMPPFFHCIFEDHELEPIILPGCDAEEEQTTPEKEQVHA